MASGDPSTGIPNDCGGISYIQFIEQKSWVCSRCGASVRPDFKTCPSCSDRYAPCEPTPYYPRDPVQPYTNPYPYPWTVWYSTIGAVETD